MYLKLKSVGICLLLACMLSSCASMRKADDRSYTRTHRTSKSKNRKPTSTKRRTATKSKTTARTSTSTHTRELNSVRRQVVSIAKKYQGSPYLYGGENPSGFDCSGFLQYVYRQAGVDLPRTSNEQARLGKSKSWNQSKVGDIIFFGSEQRIAHVGLVCDVTDHSLKVIHSTSTRGVTITDIRQSTYWQERLLYARDVIY